MVSLENLIEALKIVATVSIFLFGLSDIKTSKENLVNMDFKMV